MISEQHSYELAAMVSLMQTIRQYPSTQGHLTSPACENAIALGLVARGYGFLTLTPLGLAFLVNQVPSDPANALAT